MTVSTIRINGKLSDGNVVSKTLITPVRQIQIDPAKMTTYCNEARIEKAINDFFRKYAIPASLGTSILMFTTQAFAAVPDAVPAVAAPAIHGLADKLIPLLHMVQDFALPVGIIVSSWGLIEMIMGNIESGKHKMKWAIIGYIGMFLIPQVFYAIHDAFANV